MTAQNSVRETAKFAKTFERCVAAPNSNKIQVLLLANADGDNVIVLETSKLSLKQIEKHLRKGGSVFLTTRKPTQ